MTGWQDFFQEIDDLEVEEEVPLPDDGNTTTEEMVTHHLRIENASLIDESEVLAEVANASIFDLILARFFAKIG